MEVVMARVYLGGGLGAKQQSWTYILHPVRFGSKAEGSADAEVLEALEGRPHRVGIGPLAVVPVDVVGRGNRRELYIPRLTTIIEVHARYKHMLTHAKRSTPLAVQRKPPNHN